MNQERRTEIDLLTQVATRQENLITSLQAHIDEGTKWKKEIADRLAEHGTRLGNLERDAFLKDKIRRSAWTLVKATVGAALLILTFKFGDVGPFIERMLK